MTTLVPEADPTAVDGQMDGHHMTIFDAYFFASISEKDEKKLASNTLEDGRGLRVPLAWYPRLLHATPAERSQRARD